jgi:hypothetical protein
MVKVRKVGESQPSRLFKTFRKNDKVQLHFNFSKKCPHTFKKSHAHFQCVHNKCAEFGECQPKGVREVDYTK